MENLRAPPQGEPRAPIHYDADEPYHEENGPTLPMLDGTFQTWPPSHRQVLMGSSGTHHHVGNQAWHGSVNGRMQHYERLTQQEQRRYRVAFYTTVEFRRIVWQNQGTPDEPFWVAVGTVACTHEEILKKVANTFRDARNALLEQQLHAADQDILDAADNSELAIDNELIAWMQNGNFDNDDLFGNFGNEVVEHAAEDGLDLDSLSSFGNFDDDDSVFSPIQDPVEMEAEDFVGFDMDWDV